MTRIAYWPWTNSFVGLACLMLAALWDVLFWGRPVGCSAAVFAGVMGAILVWRAPGLWRSGLGRVTAAGAAMAVLALVEEPSPLALLVVIGGWGTVVLVAQREMKWTEGVSTWLGKWISLLASPLVRIVLDNKHAARWLWRHPKAAGRLMRVFAGMAWWVLPLMAGAVFIGLFGLANPIIERWLRSGWEMLWAVMDCLAFVSMPRVLLWSAVIVGAYGVLRYRRIRRRATGLVPVSAEAKPGWRAGLMGWGTAWLGTGLIVRCLVVFNGVFAVQSGLDVMYLFGGVKLPAGMTYAQYAHRGAYPLVFTALLAGMFVLVAFQTGGAGQRSTGARRLVYAWIGQNVFLMVSTIWRIWLYVDAYSLTRWRVAALIWIVLVGLGFLWIGGRIARGRSNAWLWRMNAVTLAGVLLVCAFVNFDGLIADFNVRHCREVTGEGVPVDIGYLERLGPEALPALAWLEARDAGGRLEIARARRALSAELRREMQDWRGWTWRRWRAMPAEVKVEVAGNYR